MAPARNPARATTTNTQGRPIGEVFSEGILGVGKGVKVDIWAYVGVGVERVGVNLIGEGVGNGLSVRVDVGEGVGEGVGESVGVAVAGRGVGWRTNRPIRNRSV